MSNEIRAMQPGGDPDRVRSSFGAHASTELDCPRWTSGRLVGLESGEKSIEAKRKEPSMPRQTIACHGTPGSQAGERRDLRDKRVGRNPGGTPATRNELDLKASNTSKPWIASGFFWDAGGRSVDSILAYNAVFAGGWKLIVP